MEPRLDAIDLHRGGCGQDDCVRSFPGGSQSLGGEFLYPHSLRVGRDGPDQRSAKVRLPGCAYGCLSGPIRT